MASAISANKAELLAIANSVASEKMPWLVVHPVTPLVLLGALTIEGVAHHARLPWLLTRRGVFVSPEMASLRRNRGMFTLT